MQEMELVRETRQVADFDQVILRGSVCCAEVYIEQGETESLVIEAGADVISRIEARVRERTLILRVRGSWLEKLGDLLANDLTRPKMVFRLVVRQLKTLDVYGASYIHVPSLEVDSLSIAWRGAGDLAIDSLSAQDLTIEQSGAGSMKISGQVERQRVNSGGVGHYDGSELISEQTDIRVTGSSFARLCVTGTLKAVVHGVGVVEYTGDPRVRSRITGVGSVVRVG